MSDQDQDRVQYSQLMEAQEESEMYPHDDNMITSPSHDATHFPRLAPDMSDC